MTGGLRFRVFIGGELTLEEWIDDCADAVAAASRHAAMALSSGKPWLIESFDPDAPADAAYVRFGTDGDGMVLPSAMPMEEIVARTMEGAE